jgi:hypothetical protein
MNDNDTVNDLIAPVSATAAARNMRQAATIVQLHDNYVYAVHKSDRPIKPNAFQQWTFSAYKLLYTEHSILYNICMHACMHAESMTTLT